MAAKVFMPALGCKTNVALQVEVSLVYREFHDNQGYIVRPLQRKTKSKFYAYV